MIKLENYFYTVYKDLLEKYNAKVKYTLSNKDDKFILDIGNLRYEIIINRQFQDLAVYKRINKKNIKIDIDIQLSTFLKKQEEKYLFFFSRLKKPLNQLFVDFSYTFIINELIIQNGNI
ncbi:hypothetical protein RJI07_05190 [Mycoplasmatota bacterium WC30]